MIMEYLICGGIVCVLGILIAAFSNKIGGK